MTIQELQAVSEAIANQAERKLSARRLGSVAISVQVSGHDADATETQRPYVKIVNGVNCGGFAHRAISNPLPSFVNYSVEVTR